MKVKYKGINKKRMRVLVRPQPAPMLSREQQFMGELFGHGDKVMFGSEDSQCLPVLNGSLIPNRVNPPREASSEDLFFSKNRDTKQMFGF